MPKPADPGTATGTVASALRAAAHRLQEAAIETPLAEARLLLAHATGIDRTRQLLQAERRLTADEQRAFAAMVGRRAAREPMAYILGRREFFGLDFAVSPAVLVPRPETELVVELGLALLEKAGAPRILDIATGSGCLLITLLHLLPRASGIATDASPEALTIARSNADRHAVTDRAQFIKDHWASGVDGNFDLIVSNPPYIPTLDIGSLDPEVATFEPHLALDGGEDGLMAYKQMTGDLKRLLAPGGRVYLEIGAGQADALATWFANAGFDCRPHRDLAQVVRVLELD